MWFLAHPDQLESTNNGTILGYDTCTDGSNELLQQGQVRIISQTTELIQCDLTGMVPEQEHRIEVFADSVLIIRQLEAQL